MRVTLLLLVFFIVILGWGGFFHWPHLGDFKPLSLDAQTQNTIARSKTEPGTFIIHKPPSGCPEDFNFVQDYFIEKDRSHRDACVVVHTSESATMEVSVDYLLAGETAPLDVLFEETGKSKAVKAIL